MNAVPSPFTFVITGATVSIVQLLLLLLVLPALSSALISNVYVPSANKLLPLPYV